MSSDLNYTRIHKWNDVIEHFVLHRYKQSLWDYVTSLRGADIKVDNDNAVKALVTGFIRGIDSVAIVVDITTCYSYICSYHKQHLKNALDELLSSDQFSHFKAHARLGLNALASYYSDKNEKKLASLIVKMSTSLGTYNSEYLNALEEFFEEVKT